MLFRSEFFGKHYHVEYVNPWPRPFQQPHPPIWIPSQGSRETIDFAADPKHKYTYLQTFSPIKQVGRYLQMYRDVAQGFGYTASPRQLGWASMVYVGDSDEAALREAGPHFEVFRNRFLKKPLEMLLPPGYTSRASMKAIAMAKGEQTVEVNAKRAVEMGMFVCGSARTVRETLISYAKEIGFGNLLVMLQFGTLPADLTLRNMHRFAEEVMPAVRQASRNIHGDAALPLD